MKIKRAVKCAGIEDQIKGAVEIAKRANIFGLEIQALSQLIQNNPFEQRAKIITESLKNYPFSSLSYHYPIPSSEDIQRLTIEDLTRKYDLTSENADLALRLTEETIKEAAFVGKELGIKTEIPIIVHLIGFVKKEQATMEEREKRLKLGTKRLIELKKMTDSYSEEYGLNLKIVRENNCPGDKEPLPLVLLDHHPEDIAKSSNLGIGTTLDFAHIWLVSLYYKNGRSEFPGVDLSKKLYPEEIDLNDIIDLLIPSLKVLHLNDAGDTNNVKSGYTKEFEGLEIGKGTFPHSEVIPLICESISQDIIGTYEIRDGHLGPEGREKIFKSDLYYRKIFKSKFNEYFE